MRTNEKRRLGLSARPGPGAADAVFREGGPRPEGPLAIGVMSRPHSRGNALMSQQTIVQALDLADARIIDLARPQLVQPSGRNADLAADLGIRDPGRAEKIHRFREKVFVHR